MVDSGADGCILFYSIMTIIVNIDLASGIGALVLSVRVASRREAEVLGMSRLAFSFPFTSPASPTSPAPYL
jgi:hypothetical protein